MFRTLTPVLAAAFALVATFFDVPTADAQGPTQVVANALLEFEAGMTWEAVQPSWRQDRDPWVAKLRSARAARDVAVALGELEVAMKWEAVDGSWRGRRASWVQQVAAATSATEVAGLLLDLEVATTWEAMFESWRTTRPGWVATLRGIAGR